MITIAIDVGVTGAIASIDERGCVLHLSDLPVTEYGKLKWITGGTLLSRIYEARRIDRPARVFVEHVHAMPELSTVAANAMGRTFGSVVATVEIAQLPLELVSPQKWKRTLGVTSDKDSSLSRARVLFPAADLGLQKHHNRAEALLIAHYAQRYLMGVAAVQTSAAASAAVGELDLVGGGKAA